MTAARKAVRSLASLRVGRQTLYLAPIRAIAYAAVSTVIVFLLLLGIDRWVLGSLEAGGWTAGEQWARYNKRIEENHRRKTTTNECQLREWNGQPLPQSDGRRKILVIGDSFVWGPPYVTLNHLWWRQLAIELERRGYRDVDVVAVGQPGWSTHRQLECASHLISEVKPDVVIWGYVTNDPDEKLVRQIFDTQDRFPLGQRARVALRRLFPSLMFKFEWLRNEKLAAEYSGPKYGYRYPQWELELLQGDNFEHYQQTVREVGDLLRRTDVPCFLLTLPSWPCREYYEPRYAPVVPLWEAAGVPVRNTIEDFVERYGNAPQTGPKAIEWGINPADSHPGPKATHFHAVMAADYLEANFLELLGPKEPDRPHELAINDWLPFDLNVRKVSEATKQVVIAPFNAPPIVPSIGEVTQQEYELDYSVATALIPRLALDEPTALVALRFPLPIDEIHLEGPGLVGAEVWISMLDSAEHFDENRWRRVGKFFGTDGGWFAYFTPPELSNRAVAEIRFHAKIRGPDHRLTLTLTGRPRAMERP